MEHLTDVAELLYSISDPAYIIDEDGYVALANDAWLGRLGLGRDAVIGRHLKSVIWDYRFSRQCDDEAILPFAEDISADQELIALHALERGTAVSCLSEDHARHTSAYPLRGGGLLLGVFVIECETVSPSAPASPRELCSQTRMLGQSPAMLRLRQLIHEVAPTDSTVILTGETGCGKEVAAREIQRLSRRSEKPFVDINCSAIPESLLEAELFGYEGGAFTGSTKYGREGLFEAADHGTIFLDEIGEMPLSMQPKLLRTLQEQSLYRVGGNKSIPINVRILAATNRNLWDMVQEKRFREDLYYRLNVVTIRIPPLRDRDGDILLLADAFLQQFNEKYQRQKHFSKSAQEFMLEYRWPGNIRELRNLVERLVILGAQAQITVAGVRKYLMPAFAEIPEEEEGLTLKEATDQFQYNLIKTALIRYGSTYKAAAALGTSQSTLSRKARQLGIQVTTELCGE